MNESDRLKITCLHLRHMHIQTLKYGTGSVTFNYKC